MELQQIQSRIFIIRGLRVMMDFHLAELYDVPTKALNQAVKRNPRRFPPDFMIQLSASEWDAFKTQMAVFDVENTWSQFVTTSRSKRNLPYAFTEQGVAMLSSVLKSDRAIEINIAIIRAFVLLRYYLWNYEGLSNRIDALEKEMNRKFEDVHEALKYLIEKGTPQEIGFRQGGRN